MKYNNSNTQSIENKAIKGDLMPLRYDKQLLFWSHFLTDDASQIEASIYMEEIEPGAINLLILNHQNNTWRRKWKISY